MTASWKNAPTAFNGRAMAAIRPATLFSHDLVLTSEDPDTGGSTSSLGIATWSPTQRGGPWSRSRRPQPTVYFARTHVHTHIYIHNVYTVHIYAHTCMLSLPVYQVSLDWLPLPCIALIQPSQLSCPGISVSRTSAS